MLAILPTRLPRKKSRLLQGEMQPQEGLEKMKTKAGAMTAMTPTMTPTPTELQRVMP